MLTHTLFFTGHSILHINLNPATHSQKRSTGIHCPWPQDCITANLRLYTRICNTPTEFPLVQQQCWHVCQFWDSHVIFLKFQAFFHCTCTYALLQACQLLKFYVLCREREKQCPGRRLPLNVGELAVLLMGRKYKNVHPL